MTYEGHPGRRRIPPASDELQPWPWAIQPTFSFARHASTLDEDEGFATCIEIEVIPTLPRRVDRWSMGGRALDSSETRSTRTEVYCTHSGSTSEPVSNGAIRCRWSFGDAGSTDRLSPWESRTTKHGFPYLRNTKGSTHPKSREGSRSARAAVYGGSRLMQG